MRGPTEIIMTQYPLITVVGGSGFVGRHLIKLLAAEGYRLRVLVRDCIAAEYLKTAGTPGQVVLEHADITRPETLSGKLAGSVAVINLVSILYECGRQTFKSINIEGARAVATEARKANVPTLVHLSALGVDRMADTEYGTSKHVGENAVREAFPGAIILRPSIIIGPEDGFFQRFGRMSMIAPFLPLIGGGKTRFQPVLVTDVTAAILTALRNPACKGQSYEVAGPNVYSFRELLEMMTAFTKRKTRFIALPFGIASFKAWIIQTLAKVTPWAPLLTCDQVKALKHDNITSAGAPGLYALGITPTPIESQLPIYLSRFMKG